MAGLKPREVWQLELWEYNMFMKGFDRANKQNNANSIMTGYYSAYYVNNPKKAKSPNELIQLLYKDPKSDDGMAAIEKIKKLERRNYE